MFSPLAPDVSTVNRQAFIIWFRDIPKCLKKAFNLNFFTIETFGIKEFNSLLFIIKLDTINTYFEQDFGSRACALFWRIWLVYGVISLETGFSRALSADI